MQIGFMNMLVDTYYIMSRDKKWFIMPYLGSSWTVTSDKSRAYSTSHIEIADSQNKIWCGCHSLGFLIVPEKEAIIND